MTAAERLAELKKMVQDEVVLKAPHLAEMRFEVRTVGFPAPFCEMKKGVADIVGCLLVEWGYDVPTERRQDFHSFLLEAENALVGPDVLPSGARYLGTYIVTAGQTKDFGSYRTIWGFADYEALGKFSQMRAEQGSALAQALNGLRQFLDPQGDLVQSVSIYQRAVGLPIF